MNIYTHPLFLKQGKSFPGMENPNRLEDVVKELSCIIPDAKKGAVQLLRETHDYIDKLMHYDGDGIEAVDKGETFIDKLSYNTALFCATVSMIAAERLSFGLIRPPGHHAHKNMTHGFCLVNNMAMAAKHLVTKGERVLILDTDIHHGCGTADIVAGDDNICLFSPYKGDIWPGDNHYKRAGNLFRVPIFGPITDKEYIGMLEEEFVDALNMFQPSVVGVSLGLDTFKGEQFGWEVTAESIHKLKEILSNQPHFGILEGGYNADSIYEGIQAFTR